jgi:hypothetical protein
MRLFLAAIPLLAALPAQAATPGAWAALDTASAKACARDISRQAARAHMGTVEGKVLGIGPARDEDRFYALLLTGRIANFRSQWLCLYDKRGKTAVAREIEKR